MRFFVLIALMIGASAQANNTIDDMFNVIEIKGKQAFLEGKTKGLKAGDSLYFARSPFQFKIEAVTGNKVTIALPDKHDLTATNALIRNPTPSILKSIATENKLKQALEE
jgi:hypothetical protein